MSRRDQDYYKKPRRIGRVIFWIIFAEAVALLIGLLVVLLPDDEDEVINELLNQDATILYETETESEKIPAVPRPDIDEQLLEINEFSRPGKKVVSIDKIVIHYLANPMTTAQQNHDYFYSLKDRQDDYMSANYVIGLEGEIIQCVPDGEVAWASNSMNSYSISIENCHEDETGKFNDATYWSDVHLVAYLTEKYGLGRDDIIRHYDVTGKNCPKYFVEHPEAWEQFKDDVMDYRARCEAALEKALKEAAASEQEDVLAAYLESLDIEEETEDGSLWDVLQEKAESIASAKDGAGEAAAEAVSETVSETAAENSGG